MASFSLYPFQGVLFRWWWWWRKERKGERDRYWMSGGQGKEARHTSNKEICRIEDCKITYSLNK